MQLFIFCELFKLFKYEYILNGQCTFRQQECVGQHFWHRMKCGLYHIRSVWYKTRRRNFVETSQPYISRLTYNNTPPSVNTVTFLIYLIQRKDQWSRWASGAKILLTFPLSFFERTVLHVRCSAIDHWSNTYLKRVAPHNLVCHWFSEVGASYQSNFQAPVQSIIFQTCPRQSSFVWLTAPCFIAANSRVP